MQVPVCPGRCAGAGFMFRVGPHGSLEKLWGSAPVPDGEPRRMSEPTAQVSVADQYTSGAGCCSYLQTSGLHACCVDSSQHYERKGKERRGPMRPIVAVWRSAVRLATVRAFSARFEAIIGGRRHVWKIDMIVPAYPVRSHAQVLAS